MAFEWTIFNHCAHSTCRLHFHLKHVICSWRKPNPEQTNENREKMTVVQMFPVCLVFFFYLALSLSRIRFKLKYLFNCMHNSMIEMLSNNRAFQCSNNNFHKYSLSLCLFLSYESDQCKSIIDMGNRHHKKKKKLIIIIILNNQHFSNKIFTIVTK